jgi:YidC/Oxa1 family membrane protein insertase
MYKQDYGKYLHGNSLNPKEKTKKIFKEIWKWTKVVFIIFLLVSMLWGCVQMFMPRYTVNQIQDMTGNKVYSPGVSFEIVIRALDDDGFKTHWFVPGENGVSEYDYTQISNWGEAFTVGKSPYYGLFVYPFAFVLVGFIRLFSGVGADGLMDGNKASYGVSALFAILLTAFISRGIVLGFTWKSQKNQERMQIVQGKQAEIQAKYAGKKDPASKQKQQMETMELYKKEGISPFSSIVASFASMPFLFAMYAIVRSAHALKVAQVGEIKLIEQPWQQVLAGNWVYFTLLVMYLPLQVCSMLLPLILQMVKQKGQILSPQQKKVRRRQFIMQAVFAVVFIFIVATVASGVAIYWIFSSAWQICQTLGFHFAREMKARRIRAQKTKSKRIAQPTKKVAKDSSSAAN